ncbi:MAG: hypothetical protein M3387_00840 [Actinomycetota bacterium]|nr:hypothetical protein [Actinomycetota bacterium]
MLAAAEDEAGDVVISLLLMVIATAVLLVETQTINHFAETAADPTASAADLRGLGTTLVHSIGGTIVLTVIMVLNVYKPQGMTRYGWRKQHEQRRNQQKDRGVREDNPWKGTVMSKVADVRVLEAAEAAVEPGLPESVQRIVGQRPGDRGPSMNRASSEVHDE